MSPGPSSSRGAAVACALLLTIPPARAGEDFEPLARCAAFWLARHDFQARYAIAAPPDPAALRTARRFRDAARRRRDGEAGVDSFIGEERADLLRLQKAFILGGDDQSREVFDLIATRCEALAGDLPAQGK